MTLSHFAKASTPLCKPDAEALTARDKEIEHISNMTAFCISVNTDSHDAPYSLCCSGCYIRREPNAPNIVKFQTIEELITHSKQCEQNERHRLFKCNSCHFSSHSRNDINVHQMTLQEESSLFRGKSAHNGIDYLLPEAALMSVLKRRTTQELTSLPPSKLSPADPEQQRVDNG